MNDKTPGLGDLGGMLKQLKQMQGELVKAQKELAKETVTAEAGKGAVKVTVTGDQRVTALEIDPALVAAGDAKQLSRLLQEALNQALDDSREMAKKRLGPLSAGLNI
jgi:hypothetical protein